MNSNTSPVLYTGKHFLNYVTRLCHVTNNIQYS